MIKLLIQGEHTNHHKEHSYLIYPLTSSVTLIKTAGKNIVVDTGSVPVTDLLIDELKKENLKPEEIDFVIITHYHLDHTFNVNLFKKALVYSPKAIFDVEKQTVEVFHSLEKQGSPPGVKLIETKGHTHEHISVLYEENNKKYIMAGDAFREDFVLDNSLLSARDCENFKKSLKLIVEMADVIIPGHGEVVEGRKLEIIRSKLRIPKS